MASIERLENVFGEFIENSLDVNSYDLPSMGYYYFLMNKKLEQCIDKLSELEGDNSTNNQAISLTGAIRGIVKILPRDYVPSDSSSTYNIAVYDYNNTSFGRWIKMKWLNSYQQQYPYHRQKNHQ